MGIYQSQLEGCAPVRFPVSLTTSGVGALRSAGAVRRTLPALTGRRTRKRRMLWK